MIEPKGSHEWYYCAGSQVMQEGKPDSDSVREKIACSWLAETILKSYTNHNDELKIYDDFIGELTPNNVVIDDEMFEAARLYVTDILKYCNVAGTLKSVKVESNLDIGMIYPGMKGKSDAYIWNSEDLEIIIWNLEYGYSHVEAYENPEIMNYIAAILKLHNLDGEILKMITVKMRIIQPRSFHGDEQISEWEIMASQLTPYFNKLRDAAQQAMSGEGLCIPGLHCHYCKGRNNCSAITKTLYNYIDVIQGPVPMNLEGNNLVLEWQLMNRMTKMLKYRKSAIDAQLKAELQNGEHLPGALLEKHFGNLAWKKEVSTQQVLSIVDMLGVDIRKPDNLDTPTQALTKIKKFAKESKIKIDPKLLDRWTIRPFTGFKVVEDDGSKANKIFK